MNKIILLLVISLVFLGCTDQNTIGNTETNAIIQNWTGQTEYVNTSGLGFERHADDVLTNYTIPEIPEFNFTNITTEDDKLIVYYFYMPTCPACKAIAPEIDRMETEYAGVVFLRYDITSANGSYAYKDFTSQYGLNATQMYVPQVLVNGTIITDMFNINESLETIITKWGNIN
ncbi:MAG: thioredoxin family protein [Candidatus Micrarchaeota archaeon]